MLDPQGVPRQLNGQAKLYHKFDASIVNLNIWCNQKYRVIVHQWFDNPAIFSEYHF